MRPSILFAGRFGHIVLAWNPAQAMSTRRKAEIMIASTMPSGLWTTTSSGAPEPSGWSLRMR